MIGLISNASPVVPLEVIKAALPIGIGLASAAYLTMKIAANSSDKMVKIRPELYYVVQPLDTAPFPSPFEPPNRTLPPITLRFHAISCGYAIRF